MHAVYETVALCNREPGTGYVHIADLFIKLSVQLLCTLIYKKLFYHCLFRTWRPSFQSTQSLQQCNVQVTEEVKWIKSRWSKVLTGEQPPSALLSGQEFFWKMYSGNLCVGMRFQDFWLHLARNETRVLCREKREMSCEKREMSRQKWDLNG